MENLWQVCWNVYYLQYFVAFQYWLLLLWLLHNEKVVGLNLLIGLNVCCPALFGIDHSANSEGIELIAVYF